MYNDIVYTESTQCGHLMVWRTKARELQGEINRYLFATNVYCPSACLAILSEMTRRNDNILRLQTLLSLELSDNTFPITVWL